MKERRKKVLRRDGGGEAEAKDRGIGTRGGGGGLAGMLVTWIQEQRSGRHFDGPAVE